MFYKSFVQDRLLDKILRFIVVINRIRSLLLIICMIGDVSRIFERVEMAETTLGVAARRGTHIGATRTRVRVPTCRRRRGSYAHVYHRCVLSFRHVSHSRRFYTDICPIRGYKWVRPSYDRQSREIFL